MAVKNKKNKANASDSGSIVSYYMERKKKYYDKYAKEQQVDGETGKEVTKRMSASGSGSIVSNYLDRRNKLYDLDEKKKKIEEEKAREENAKREREEKARAEKMDPNNWFTTSDGTKYKNPSLMGYDELQMVLNHVTENKDLFKKRLADSGLFKKGFSGGWENVEPKDFEEKLGNNGVSWEDYKEYTSLWSKYQQNLEYMRELERHKPRVELEHEYDSLSDADKKIVSEAVDYEAELESNASTGFGISLAELRDKPITDAMRTADVYAKFPRLTELRDAGVDVDYIIESERTKRSNTRQKIRNSISADFADEHPILGSAASVASNLVSPVELTEDINHAIKNITSDKSYEIDYEMHPYSQYTNTTRGKVSEGIDNDIGKFVYNAGMSTIDSAADILVTKGLGKGGKLASGAASALMGANAANQTYMDTYERTGSAGQSLLTGVSAGLAEWASEKFSIENFSKLKTTTPKTFRDYAKNLVKQGIVEGSEEAAADFANAFADNAINGSKSEYNTAVKGYIQQGYTKEEAKKQATKDFFRQVAEDTMAGAFSGGLFGTYANAYSSLQYKNTVKKNGVSISENKEGNELVYYAEKHGMDTYDNEKETEKYGKISYDIMENAANRIDQAKSSNELSTVYQEISQDIPDSLGVEVDQMVRTKAQSLAEDSQQPTEKQELIELMDDSLLRAIKRTEVLNKRKQQANESLSEEIKEETMNEEENTQESYTEERIENPVPDTPAQENVTTANFKRTENAAFTASDEVVKVKGFREIGTETATVETSDGEVVSLADLSFEDVDTQNMFNIASKMENAAAATALVDHYDGRENAGVYANNFRMAYRMGRLGSISFDKMMQSSKEFRILSNKTPMRIAYEMGKAHAENEQRTEASVAPAHKMGQGEYTDNREAAEDKDSFGEVKKALARKTGLDVKDFDTLTEDDAATVNGMLSIKRGQMAFADDAENKFGVVIHESLEFASVMSEEDYNRLMGVVLNYLVDKHGVEDVHALIASYQKAYEAAEGKKTYEEAAGEMINDAVSGVFYDVDGAKSFIEWLLKDETLSGKEKKNLFQKMADLVKHIFDKIKEYIDNTPMTKAARMAAELKVEQKEEIRQLFMDAVDKAGENYRAGKSDNVIRSQYSLKVDADVSEETIEKNRKDVGKMDDIVQISGFGLKKFGNSLMEQLEGFFEYVGGKVENKDYGTIELSRNSVNSLIRHRPTFLKQAAFEAIPTVLEKGRAIGYIKNRKNNVDSLIIAAPIEITDIKKSGKYLVATSVNVTKDKNYLYLEEVFYRRINEGHTVQTRNLSTNNGDRESVYPSIISILNEIDKNVNDNENPTKENKSIRHSISVDTEGRELSEGQQKFFKDSQIVDESGSLKVMYHGTGRADRVGYYFDSKRATSGPMAFFTDDKEIAENYSRDKKDTSLDYDERYSDYHTQFRVNYNGEDISVGELWNRLPANEKRELEEKAGHICFDDDYETIIYNPDVDYGNGNFDSYLLRENNGNVLEALVQAWLDDGELFGIEEKFKEVLELAGIKDVDYYNPDYRDEKVYEVYLNVTNPFDTTNISADMLEQIKEAAGNAAETVGNEADMWDKNNVDAEQFVERLESDIKNGTTYSWTSIPDFVTDVLKENGYDGIIDKGGKYGGDTHQVVIPFYSEQIKQVTNENPTKENKDIRYSIHVDLDEQIDNVLNDTVPDNYTHVYLGKTPEVFKELGWNDLPMLMTNQHVYSTIKTQEEAKKDNRFSKRRNYHGLGKELFEKVQKQMSKPAMILKSNTSEKNADVVFVTNVKDKQGKIVIAAVKPQGIGRVKDNLTSANVVLSVYGKNKIQNYIKNAYQENRILKMNPDEAVMPMVQFHGDLLHQDYEDNLTQYKEIVKNIISSKGEKHSISVSERTEKLRHSLTDTMSTEESLVKENEYLRQVIKTLESEFKPGVKTVPEPSRVDAVCRKLLKKYHSTFDLETFKDNVTKLYAYMNEENADYEAALKITSEIARGVLEKSTQKDTTMYDTYKSLRDYFRKTKLSLSEAQKNEVKYLYGSMGEFRKSNFGRMRIVDEGTSLDQVWGELCEQYPELFHADTNDGDMITEVLNVLDGLRPVYRNVSGEDMEQGSYDLALQIYSEMSKVPQKQTFKDKAEAAVEYEWKESNRVYMNLLNDFRKECKKQFEEGLKVSLEEQNADKKQRIKEAYGKIRDYVNVIEVTQNGELIKKYQNEIEKQKRYIERLKKGQDRKIAELKMENRQYRSNLSEKRKQTEEKNKIRRLHARMRQMLIKPKEGMYVPQDLVRSVIDVCEAVNLGAKEGTKLYASLDEAKSCFDAMKSDPDYNFSSEYDEEVAYHLEQIKDKFRNAEKNNDKSIYDLSSQDLEEVYDAMNEVYQTIRRATKLIRKEGETDARKAAEKVIKEVRGAKGLSSWMSSHKVFRGMNRFIMKSLSSYRTFRRITGYADGEFMNEWKELNEGQRKMLQIQQEGESILAEVMEDKDVLELMKTFDKKEGLVDSGLRYKNGKKVFITKGMRMALVMHGMNQDNMRHMIYGGITLPNMDAYVKGDRKGAYDKTHEVKGITSAKIQAMEDAMSPEERKVLQAFKKLFHEYTGKVINETALELYGYKKANEKNYYPIHVDNDYVKTEINSVKMDKTIEGAGYLKDRVHSTKPLVMESIVDTAQRSLKMVSEFGGLAIPLRNFQKVYNGASWKVADTDGDGIKADSVMVQDDTVKKAMSDVWGQSASEYIDNLIADLQNARASEYTVFDQLRGNFAGAVLTGNVSVIMKQAASYPTAVATLGWEPVLKALGKGGKNGLPISRADRELIAKYTPLLWYRNKGNSTQEMADISSMDNLTNRVPVVRDVKNMIQKVDVATVGRLWYAAQYYVDEHYKALKKGTDAYYQQVAEIFNQCVEDTQPNYTVMQRPDYLRDPSKLKKVFFMFMTQRMQNGGILYDATCNLYAKMKNGTETQKKEAKREFARAVSSQLVSAAVLSTMTFLARGLLHKINPYRDDENELTLLSFFEEWMNGVLGSLSGSFIGGNELYTMIYSAITGDTYYGIEVSLVSELNGVGEAFVEMANGLSKTTSDSDEEAEKGKEQIGEAFLDAASGIAKMCGVPADNVKNIATGIWKNVEDVTSGEGLFSFSTDKEEPKATVYAKKIYDALMDGDKEAAKEYRSKMTKSGKKGDGDVETAVRTQLVKRNDLVRQAAEYRLNNNTDGYMKIYKQLKGMGFSHNEVVGSINSVLGDLKGESSSGPKAARDNISMYKAEDLIRAIEAEKGYEDILNQMYKEKVDSGKDDKEARAAIRASVTRVYKGKYRECKTAHEKQAILKKMYLLKIDGKCLYDNGILKKWNEDK
ncbi:MAG: hypothetical protein MR304_06625 [Eubacterium sp.]|nr:hypothetical protein [Eubacterium sp.]